MPNQYTKARRIETPPEVTAAATPTYADAREAARVSAPVPVRTKVRATRLGIYGMDRRRPGDVFWVAAGTRLGSWMEIVATETPLVAKSAADVIRQRDAELRARKSPTYLQPNAADELPEPETPGPEDDISI